MTKAGGKYGWKISGFWIGFCLIVMSTLAYAQSPANGPGQASTTDPFEAAIKGEQDGNVLGDSVEDPFGDAMAMDADPFGEDKGSKGAEDDPWEKEAAGAPWNDSASGKRFAFGGRVWNKFAFDTQEDNEFEDLYQNHVQLQLDATYRPSQAVEMKLSAGGDYYTYGRHSDGDDDANFRLFDAYVNLAEKGFNLKAGNQIVRWGKTDGFSPLDNLNPEDFRDGIGGKREDRKLQIPMVNLELYPGVFTLQGIYIPVFIKSKYDVKHTDWALFDHYDKQIGAFGVVEEDLPNTFENGQAGLRLSGIAGRLDYAFSYLYTHEDVGSLDSLNVPPGFDPVFSSRVVRDLTRFASATNQNIRLLHDRQHIYGFEFETTLAAFGLRGDLAYMDRTIYITEQLQRIRKPVMQYMVGADYNGPGAFYLNVQFGQIFIDDYDDNIILARELSSNINGSISKGFFNEDLKLEFRWFYDFDGDGSLYNPKCIVNYWLNVTLELGVEIFEGTDAHPLGFFRDNDQVYALAEFHF